MIYILFSVSSIKFNDDVVPALAHYMVSASLSDGPFLFARYINEDDCLELLDRDLNLVSQIEPAKRNAHSRHSVRYECVSQLLKRMNAGDILNVDRLSDLGNTASETTELYFSFLKKGISLTFYDAYYLSPTVHHLEPIPSNDQKDMITTMIEIYCENPEDHPKQTIEQTRKLSRIGREKKSSVSNIREISIDQTDNPVGR